ncbi:MAG: hypothetical protein OK438_01305 [Thaumarchaeota archaeon]|nr:hypothetical protein [Nitrososphaerota archaeon]
MNQLGVRKAFVLFSMCALLTTLAFSPVAKAAANGPYSISWADSVWNNRYPGNTVEFDFYLVNSDPTSPTDTISSFQLVTPWQTYFPSDLPASLCDGCDYYYFVNVTIPSSVQPGDVTWTYSFSGTYSDSSHFCASTGNVCTNTITLTLSPDPYALQTQVTNLESSITTLNSNIASLNTQLTTAKSNVTSLQARVISYQSQVASLMVAETQLQGQLALAKGNETLLQQQLTTSRGDLTTANTALAAAESQLGASQSQLNTAQSSLSTYSSVYLPLAVLAPSIIAVLLLVLYLRKGHKTVP